MAKKEHKSGEWGGWDSANVYSEPEKCGLKIVAAVEAEPDYDFHILVCFKDVETGSLWLAYDSGCSCPVPFEDFHSFADFTPFHSEVTLDRAVKQHCDLESYARWNVGEINAFKRKCRAAIRARKKAAA